MMEKISDFEFPSSPGRAFEALPFRYKTLLDFEMNYGRISSRHPSNYVIYQLKFSELATHIFKEKRWSFVRESRELYVNLERNGYDRRASWPMVANKKTLH